MSLWKRFKEELGKGYDQVNMLDGGKSYKTRTSSGPVGYDRVRDVVDANTKWDYEKRNRANSQAQGFRPNMTYKQEQEELYGKSNVADNFGQSIVNPIARSVNTFGTNVVKLGALPTIAVDLTQESIFGTDQSYQDKLNKANTFLDEWGFGKDNGLLHAGTHFQRTEELNDPKKMAGTILQTGADLGSFIPAGKAVGAGYTGTKALAPTILRQGTENAAYNIVGNVGEQLNYTGKVDPKQVAVAGVTGYVAPVPFYGAGKLAKGGRNQISRLINKGAQEATDTPIKVNVADGLELETTPKTVKVEPTKTPKPSRGAVDDMSINAKNSIENTGITKPNGVERAGGYVENGSAPPVRYRRLEDGSIVIEDGTHRLEYARANNIQDFPMEDVTDLYRQPAQGTVRVTPEIKKGQTQGMADLMPDLRARQGNTIDVQAKEIVGKYGGKEADVSRNIQRYGYDATLNMYAQKADSPSIRNIDAVVTAELKKQYPDKAGIRVTKTDTPSVKVMSPEEEASLFASAPEQVKAKTTFKEDLEKLRGQAFDAFDNEDDSIIDDALEANVMKQADEQGFDVFWNEDWNGYMVALKDTNIPIKDASIKMQDLAKQYGFETKVNSDGTIRLYHGTNDAAKTAILQKGFDDNTTFFSPSKEVEYGGVNGSGYYGDSTVVADVDPRKLVFNPSGEFYVEDVSGIVRVLGDEQPTVKVAQDVGAGFVKDEDGNLVAKQPLRVEEPTPEPTIKVIDGQKIDTTTGEILGTPTQPAKNLDDFVKNLPDSKTVTREEADALILEGTDWLRKGAQAIDDALKRDGDSYENFSRAIHQANIDGVEPPAKYAQYYNEFVKPALDKYRDASGRVVGENIGDVDKYYLPRMRVTDAGQVVFDDTTLINSIDNKVFGSSMSRRTDEFQLGVDDIDHTPEGLSRYATQTLSERYRDAKAVGKVIDQAKARGVELDVPQARTVVDMENQLSQEISDAARKGGVFASGTEKLDLVDSIGKIGTAKGKEKFVLDKGLSWANRQISDSNELYDIPYGGSGKTVGEVMGFGRYTRAEAGAVLLDDTVTKNGLDVAEHLDDYYKEVNIDPDAKAKIIDNTRKRIDYINNKLASMTDRDGNPVFTEDQLLSRRQHAYMNAEKNIARQQLVEFLENTEVQSKQLKKNINQDARRMLVMDASNRSIADKTVGAIVGIKYVGLLGYSVRSALFNVLESRRVFSKYGTKDFLHGVYQAFKDPEMARRMGVHETRVSDVLDVQNKNINPKWWKPMGLFQKSEQWKDNVLLHASQNHYKSKGLGDAELLDAVLDDFNKYGIKYGQAGTLGFNKSKTGRLAGQFLQFAIKDWKIRISEGIKAMGGKGTTEAEKKAAQAYIARDIPATLATYLTMSAALGISWQEVAGLINPMQSSPIDKDAPTDVKVVNSVPGGPFIQDLKDLYIATRMAFEEAEEGETPQLGEVYKNQLIKDALTYVPGGQQIFNRTGEFINDQMRGYDENSQGRARYEAADDPLNIAKGLIFGGYTTDNAREYYGRTGVAGDLPGMGGEQKRPVSQQYQNLINEGADAGDIIEKSRAKQDRDTKFYNTPQGKAWKELYSTTYNPDTGKYESDVISPEKWKGVQADKSSTTYTQLKEAAQQRSRDFGDPVDPLFTDKWGRYKNEIMTMRSQYTGDDKEMKDIANSTTEWYKEYMKDYIAYINQIKDREYEESDQYGVSPRVKEYWDLTTKNPAIPENTARDYPIISRYYDIKNNQGEETAKEFFKANADELSAAFDAQTKAKFDWTNKMRALEGAQPLAWDVFQNITFGYEADKESVYRQLGYKLGKFGGGGGSGSKGLREADFGRAKAAPEPTIKVKVSKVKATGKPVKKITIKRTGKRI